MRRLLSSFRAAWGRLFGRAKARLARPKRRWIVAGGAGVLLVGGVTVFALAGGEAAGPSERASAASTASIERRDLSESLNESGDLGFAGSEPVIARRSGTVTWLPKRGRVIGRGDRLLEVDELPVSLMFGTVPAYRDLEQGIEDGVDVKQLERNLVALGFDPYGEITVDDEFTAATTEAVNRWQEDLGVEETGVVALGDVVFMDGRRRVSSLSVSLGTGIGSSGGTGSSPASSSGQEATTTLASYAPVAYAAEGTGGVDPGGSGNGESAGGTGGSGGQGGSGGSGGAGNGGDSDSGGVKPGDSGGGGRDEAGSGQEAGGKGGGTPSAPVVSGAPSGGGSMPAAQSSGDGSDGASDGGAPTTEVMDTTSDRRAVTVELGAADQDFARKGARAVVDMPDGGEAKGRITAVSTEASEAESGSGAGEEESDPELVIEVVIRLERRAEKETAIEEAPVTVELERVISENALTVPVTAVGAGAGGGYTLTLIDDDGTTSTVPVETGVFSDGYVEIEGEGLRAGMKVEVPR